MEGIIQRSANVLHQYKALDCATATPQISRLPSSAKESQEESIIVSTSRREIRVKKQGVIYSKFRGPTEPAKPYITHLFRKLIGPAVNFYSSFVQMSPEQ